MCSSDLGMEGLVDKVARYLLYLENKRERSVEPNRYSHPNVVLIGGVTDVSPLLSRTAEFLEKGGWKPSIVRVKNGPLPPINRIKKIPAISFLGPDIAEVGNQFLKKLSLYGPVLNGADLRITAHKRTYEMWNKCMIPCPRLFETPTPPYVLREAVGDAGSGNQFLVKDLPEPSGYKDPIRVEWIDTKGEDGLYRKYRVIVVGDEVIPRSVHISMMWEVRLKTSIGTLGLDKEDETFVSSTIPDSLKKLCVGAMKCLGLDFGALDLSFLPDGSPIFWEVNRCPGMDRTYDWSIKAENRFYEEVEKWLISCPTKRS